MSSKHRPDNVFDRRLTRPMTAEPRHPSRHSEPTAACVPFRPHGSADVRFLTLHKDVVGSKGRCLNTGIRGSRGARIPQGRQRSVATLSASSWLLILW